MAHSMARLLRRKRAPTARCGELPAPRLPRHKYMLSPPEVARRAEPTVNRDRVHFYSLHIFPSISKPSTHDTVSLCHCQF